MIGRVILIYFTKHGRPMSFSNIPIIHIENYEKEKIIPFMIFALRQK